MGSVRMKVCLVVAVAALAAAGCGSSGSATTGGTVTTAPGAPGAPDQGSAQRGIKGEDPTGEAETTLHLSSGDCGALERIAESRLGVQLTRSAKPTPPLSKCHLGGPGVEINIFLDTAQGANQRYKNRIVETVQFNTDDPAGLPHPVPHVGEKSYENSAASWIPALGSLLAVRGGRWLTVTISVADRPDGALRAEAATLARAGFKLSAAG